MRLDRILKASRIVDLQSTDLTGALRELLEASFRRHGQKPDLDHLLAELLERESNMTTCLGNGIALPHLRGPFRQPYILAIGRAPKGLEHNGLTDYREIRLVLLLLCSERQKDYLNLLATMARLFNDRALVEQLIRAPDLETVRQLVFQGAGAASARPEEQQHRFNQFLLRETEKIARAANCSAILFFSDTFAGGVEVTDSFPTYRTIIVSRAPAKRYLEGRNIASTIEVRAYSRQRLSQLRSAILIGLTGGLFKYNDRICALGGLPASNQLDTIVVVDVEREFQGLITREGNLLPPLVKIEVFERLLAVAMELSIEGREGKPVGALFVLGDSEKVSALAKPLVLNPFHGHREEERNVLNPFMDETIKEFSQIDGCFIIRGDGVIETAGSLLHPPAQFYQSLPGGLGSRHAAAAAISQAADCAAIVVSGSTGQVNLFRRGIMLPIFDHGVGGPRR